MCRLWLSPGVAADAITVGVEEEFLLVGADGQLVRSGPDIVQAAHDAEGVLQAELNTAQVESATGVCRSAEELLTQLRELRTDLAKKAAARGLRLLPCATPLLPEHRSAGVITPRPRYEQIAEIYGGIAHIALNCACQVHLGMPDRATGIEVSNRLRPWLPALLTLTANSPFAEGLDTGYSSWRYVQASLWPTAGPPPMFESVAHYEDSVETLLQVGAMGDRGMIYWDIRLSERQPTVEVRVNDEPPTPEEAALLALVVRGLAAAAWRDAERGTPAPKLRHELLRAYLWRAAHDGFDGQCPHPSTGELIPAHSIPALLGERILPVLGDDAEFVMAGLSELLRTGDGARRQRAAYAVNRRLTDVVDDLAWPAGA